MADSGSRAGHYYADPGIIKYVNQVHAAHDQGLAEAFAAPEKNEMPAVQVGQQEGRFLELLVQMIAARKVVEVGTLAGYSAIRIARGIGASGRLWTVEFDARHAEVARQNLAAAGVSDRVEVLVGKGVEVLPTLNGHGPFDAVFVNADKGSYAEYGAWAAQNLRRGGLLIGDNAFLFGELLDDKPNAVAMRQFHEQAAQAFDSVCLPTPDGLLIGIKR